MSAVGSQKQGSEANPTMKRTMKTNTPSNDQSDGRVEFDDGPGTRGPAKGVEGGLGLRPAVLARYHDLLALRYDYPLVLARNGRNGTSVVSFSGVIDGVLETVARGADADRLRHHALRFERELRKNLVPGAVSPLSSLWSRAERSLVNGGDPLLEDSLARIRSALSVEGDVVDCDRDLPARLFRHAWNTMEEDKTRYMRRVIDRLILKLNDILRADDANSAAGLGAERLRASMGKAFADEIDFAAMSRLLTSGKPMTGLPPARRARIQSLLATLESQVFFPAPGTNGKESRTDAKTYGFVFRGCGEALASYRDRLPKLVELAKAMAMAELEIDGSYRESAHDGVFESFGADDLSPTKLARFPSYLVIEDAGKMTPEEFTYLIDVLSTDLPLKIVVQTDDIGLQLPGDCDSPSPGARTRLIAYAAIGIGGVYVSQWTSSHLYRLRDKIFRGLAFEGPALFSVYSGNGSSTGGLPPYLVSAAALESRAFPSFTYDPSAGPDWASRFSLDFNPQADRDWPVHALSYEGELLQRTSTHVAFTLVDFLACDARCARYFTSVPKENWNGTMIPLSEYVANGASAPDRVPYVLMVDRENNLYRMVVDAGLLREVRRCRDQWRSLRELGGIRNSHAERLLSKEREAWEERSKRDAETLDTEDSTVVDGSATTVTAAVAASVDATPVAGEPVKKTRPDDPFIETPRCSSCNECIKVNDRMFKYDRNKQAYIADPNAGTYVQLVQAAESCQLAIIHPGKPRNPDEPGLDELLKRAAPFL